MSDISNIDSEKVKSAVNQADSVIDRLNACVGKFADAIENLDKGWISDVKTQFMADYQNDYEAMQEMLAQLREFNTSLTDAANDFDTTEDDVLSGISSLKGV